MLKMQNIQEVIITPFAKHIKCWVCCLECHKKISNSKVSDILVQCMAVCDKKIFKTLTKSGLENTVKHGQILVLKLMPLIDKI